MFDTVISALCGVIDSLWRYSTADFESLALGTAALLAIYYGRKELSKTLVQDQVLKRLNDISDHNQELASVASNLGTKYRDYFSKDSAPASSALLDEWLKDVKTLNSLSHKCDGRVKAFCMLQRELSIRTRKISDRNQVLVNKQLASFASISCYQLESLSQTLISPKSRVFKGDDASSLLSKLQRDYFTTQDQILGPITKMFWLILEDCGAPISWRSEYARILRSNIALISFYLSQYKEYFPPVLVHKDNTRGYPPFLLISITPGEKITACGKREFWELTYENIAGNFKIGNDLRSFIPRNYTPFPKIFDISKCYTVSVRNRDNNIQRIKYEVFAESFEKRSNRFKSKLNRIWLKYKWRRLLKKCNRQLLD